MYDFSKTYEFTIRSEEALDAALGKNEIVAMDAESLLALLRTKTRRVSFGDHLKRYIYEHIIRQGDFSAIETKRFQREILDHFAENRTPLSFTPTSAKPAALAKNWLTQASVGRPVVFLLGFGLRMTVEEVSDFLTKALGEQSFCFKDPRELIYWYCLKNSLPFGRMQALLATCEAALGAAASPELALEGTCVLQDQASRVSLPAELIDLMQGHGIGFTPGGFSATASATFEALYERAKEAVAGARAAGGAGAGAPVSEAEVELCLYAETLFDESGNLKKASASTLAAQFGSKRLSRQRLRDLRLKKQPVNRFDLITLNFLLYALDDGRFETPAKRYQAFVRDTDRILTECRMWPLYTPNPYEWFLLVCLLSPIPLELFWDVMEASFSQEEQP
ncbi:MAG: hypothetical protein LBR44_11910 [Clostridiales Family XIII bacterium]|jgi:hypothetical protein|nr:hypothetical protein [Clostridiales Family XIII bacterium]